METTNEILWVDNVGLKIEMHKMLHPVIADCVRNNKPLPEEYADVFTLKIVIVDGKPRGILGWA